MPPFQTNDELPKTFSVRKKNPSLFCMAHSYANKKFIKPSPLKKKWKENKEKIWESYPYWCCGNLCFKCHVYVLFSFSLYFSSPFLFLMSFFFLILMWFSFVCVRFFLFSFNLLTCFFLLFLPTIYSILPSFAISISLLCNFNHLFSLFDLLSLCEWKPHFTSIRKLFYSIFFMIISNFIRFKSIYSRFVLIDSMFILLFPLYLYIVYDFSFERIHAIYNRFGHVKCLTLCFFQNKRCEKLKS